MNSKQHRKYTIKQIFKNHWSDFVISSFASAFWILRPSISENVAKLLRCREPQLNGYHLYRCPNHPDEERIIPHTCKSRSCATCGSLAASRWADSLNQAFPNKPYFHITFTVPKLIGHFLFYHRDCLRFLFKASAETMMTWFWEKGGCIPAVSCILHTFGRQLNWHAHIHMIISAGGLKPLKGNPKNKSRQLYSWKDVSFIPYIMAGKRFKGKLMCLIKNRLLEYYSQSVVDDLYNLNWYSHCRGQLDSTLLTIGYIGRYTKRPPIAQANIVDYQQSKQQMSFVFIETRSKNQCKYTLPVFEFIKLFIQHIPQKHAKYIYHYGLLANRCRSFYQRALKFLDLLPWLDKPHLSVDSMPYHLRRYFLTKLNPLVCKICKSSLVLALVVLPNKFGRGLRFVYL